MLSCVHFNLRMYPFFWIIFLEGLLDFKLLVLAWFLVRRVLQLKVSKWRWHVLAPWRCAQAVSWQRPAWMFFFLVPTCDHRPANSTSGKWMPSTAAEFITSEESTGNCEAWRTKMGVSSSCRSSSILEVAPTIGPYSATCSSNVSSQVLTVLFGVRSTAGASSTSQHPWEMISTCSGKDGMM